MSKDDNNRDLGLFSVEQDHGVGLNGPDYFTDEQGNLGMAMWVTDDLSGYQWLGLSRDSVPVMKSKLMVERESLILGPDGKPFKTLTPVEPEPEGPDDIVYMLRGDYNLHFKDDESAQRFARGCAVVTNVKD
jgi:hypothetical protein